MSQVQVGDSTSPSSAGIDGTGYDGNFPLIKIRLAALVAAC